MKVHLIKEQTISRYVKSNSQSRNSFALWIGILRKADWNVPHDIIATYGSADILGGGTERVVFNIGGNKYRMICRFHFGNKRVHLFVNWIGTHSEYAILCKEGKQYNISNY